MDNNKKIIKQDNKNGFNSNKTFSEIVKNIFQFILEAGIDYIQHKVEREKENIREIKSKRLSRKALVQLEKLKRIDELEARKQQNKCQAQKLINDRARLIANIFNDSGFKVTPEIIKDIFNLAELQITGKIKSQEQLKYRIVSIKSKIKLSDKKPQKKK